MPPDDQIRQLSKKFVEEIRDVLEAAVQRVLGGALEGAADDREAAVRQAVTQATAGHQAALAAEQASAAGERVRAVQAAREELRREHDARVTAESEARSAVEARQAADARAKAEAETRLAAEVRAKAEAETRVAAETRVRGEVSARQAAEVRAKAEAETRVAAEARMRGEVAARQAAETRVKSEVAARQAAETRAKAEVEARQAAEVRLEAETTARESAENEARVAAEARLAADIQARLATEAGAAAEARLAAESEARSAAETQPAATAGRPPALAFAERLVEAFRRLDEARSLTDVLGTLADHVAAEAGRVAVLVVRGTRLRGHQLRGVPDTDPATVQLPVEAGTVFGRAVSTGRPVLTSDVPAGAEGSAMGFLALPAGRVGLAVPIAVGGKVVAVLYADDAGDAASDDRRPWAGTAEILSRHASHRLEVLTVAHTAAAAERAPGERRSAGNRPSEPPAVADEKREEESARRYARLLISEIKLYNEAAVEQGRRDRDLLGRLGHDIERARRLYEEKIPAAVRRRVDCFDEEVVRTLAGGDAGLLGHTR